MSRHTSKSELKAIADLVQQSADGLSISELQRKLEVALPRRTLQRRLEKLIGSGRLKKSGLGSATLYRSPVVSLAGHVQAHASASAAMRHQIGLTSEAQMIKDAVLQPLQKRRPVGYRREFLDAYLPNQSYYLPQSSRDELAEMGQSSDVDQPAGTYLRKIIERLVIDLAWNSSRLEGNTYSLLETDRLLLEGEEAEGKDVKEHQMIRNHKAAIELLAEQADEIGFNRYTICNLHALLAENLLKDSAACGRLRTVEVGIGKSVFVPLNNPAVLEECFTNILNKAELIANPFEQAFFAMVHLPYLQPFEDVNKRVSRLAANIPLVRHNLSPLSFVDVPQEDYVGALLGVYELNKVDYLRDVFVWAYRRSCDRYAAVRQSLGEPDPFRLRYREQIKNVTAQIVLECHDKRAATATIRERASREVSEQDRIRFLEVVETELLSLHEGNIARFRLRPSEFQLWQKTWH